VQRGSPAPVAVAVCDELMKTVMATLGQDAVPVRSSPLGRSKWSGLSRIVGLKNERSRIKLRTARERKNARLLLKVGRDQDAGGE
jgi:hypothetical protein